MPAANTAAHSRRGLLLLVLILAGALGLRIHHIADSAFWLDEFCSVECSTGRGLMHAALPANVMLNLPPPLTTLAAAPPWTRIWGSLGLDNHPPLYFILLRFWRDCFGEGDLAARAFSTVPSALAIILFWDALRIASQSESAALWGAALMAIAAPQIHFAQEARGYSLLLACSLAAAAVVLRIERFGATVRRTLLLGTTALVMMLTHYYAIAPLAAMGIYCLLRLRGRDRYRVIRALLLAGVVFNIVWGPFFWRQIHGVAANNEWQTDAAADHLRLTAGRALDLPMRFFFEGPPLLAICGLLFYVVPIFLLRRKPILFWYLWMTIPIAVVAAVDLFRHTHQLDLIRYTLAASPGAYALAALALRGRWLRHAVPACLAILCLWQAPDAYSNNRDWMLLAGALRDNVQPADAIVYASAGRGDWYAGAMYLGVSHYAGAIPSPIVLMTRPLDQKLSDQLHDRATLWLLAGDASVPPSQLLPGWDVKDAVRFNDIGALYQLSAPGRRR